MLQQLKKWDVTGKYVTVTIKKKRDVTCKYVTVTGKKKDDTDKYVTVTEKKDVTGKYATVTSQKGISLSNNCQLVLPPFRRGKFYIQCFP